MKNIFTDFIRDFLEQAEGKQIKIGFVLKAGQKVIGSIVEVEIDSIEEEVSGKLHTFVFKYKNNNYIQLYEDCIKIEKVDYNGQIKYFMEFPDITVHIWFENK